MVSTPTKGVDLGRIEVAVIVELDLIGKCSPKLTRLETVTFMLQSSPHQIPKESSNRKEIGQRRLTYVFDLKIDFCSKWFQIQAGYIHLLQSGEGHQSTCEIANLLVANGIGFQFLKLREIAASHSQGCTKER